MSDDFSSDVDLLPVEKESPVDEVTDGEDCARAVLKKVVSEAKEELHTETEWVIGLKQSLAAVVAFARIDVQKEMEDPMNVREID